MKIRFRCREHDAPLRPFPDKPIKEGGEYEEYATALMEIEPGIFLPAYDYMTCGSERGDMCTDSWTSEVIGEG